MAFKILKLRIAYLKEAVIQMDQAAKDGKKIPNLENLADLTEAISTMMEDLDDRVSRLENRSS